MKVNNPVDAVDADRRDVAACSIRAVPFAAFDRVSEIREEKQNANLDRVRRRLDCRRLASIRAAFAMSFIRTMAQMPECGIVP